MAGVRLTIIGCGDAFGSGGRSHSCYAITAGGGGLFLDFGASAPVGLKRQGLTSDAIDTLVISHLHGDHFGGLPFLLLDCQFAARRTKPLRLIGPPGLRTRLEVACEVLFPGMTAMHWTFDWDVEELAPGGTVSAHGFEINAFEMIHPSGAPPLGLRLAGHGCIIAYSGDTTWTDNLVPLARDADLMILECYSAQERISSHLDWPTLKARLPELKARRIVLTHFSEAALACRGDMEKAGCIVAEDGATFDL